MKIQVETYFDPNAVRRGQRGAYRARNKNAIPAEQTDVGAVGRGCLHAAGVTADEAIRELLRTATSFGINKYLIETEATT